MKRTAAANRIYLDYNATAPCRIEARRAFMAAARRCWGNASSAYLEGREARRLLEEARRQVAFAIGADPFEIVFTSGGTEANAMALASVNTTTGAAVRRGIIVAAIEHHAVLEPARELARRGIRVDFAACDADGVVSEDKVRAVLDTDTVFVSVMLVNNETGAIQPVAKIARAARDAGAICHTDAVQALGRICVDVRQLDVDFLTLSAHKLGAPKGVGALFIRRGVACLPLFRGGPQERNLRAGTENVPAIAAFGAIAELTVTTMAEEQQRLCRLRNRLWESLAAACPGILRNGSLETCVANTLNVSFPGIDGPTLMMALDGDGIAVSTGAACAVGAAEPSHVLEAMCLGRDRCRGSLRFSLGHGTTADEIARVTDILPRLVKRMRETRAAQR